MDNSWPRGLYSAVCYLAVPCVLLRLLIKGLGNRDYWRRIPERFACRLGKGYAGKLVCIHAVSVGEVNASRPIVDYLLRQQGDYGILITTFTPTGAYTVKQHYGDRVLHRYLPYDLPICIRRFLRVFQPALLIIMETEIWPNLIRQCHHYAIPVWLVNARLSARSARGYGRVRGLMQETLARFTCIAAQGEQDAARFIKLGAKQNRVTVTGSLKFDNVPSPALLGRAKALRLRFLPERPIWIAGSTHAGEERQLLQALERVETSLGRVLLIIAPRHIERADGIARLCERQGYRQLRSSMGGQAGLSDIAVYILDTLGELTLYYAAADVAFVGGSLVESGGHNVLEPISAGIPTLTGPYTHNFADINASLQAQGLLSVVSSAEALAERLIQLFGDQQARRRLGDRGRRYIQQQQGSARHICARLAEHLAV